MVEHIHFVYRPSALSEEIGQLKRICAGICGWFCCSIHGVQAESLVIMARYEAVLLVMLKPGNLSWNLGSSLERVEVFANQVKIQEIRLASLLILDHCRFHDIIPIVLFN